MPRIPRDFLYVSKEYSTIALKNLHLDPRVKLDRPTFISVISSHNRKAFKMHLKYGRLSQDDITRGFDAATDEKNYSVVKYLLKNDYVHLNVTTMILQNFISDLALVKIALRYGMPSPSTDYMYVFNSLAERGEVDYVRRLLEDPKFNITADTIYITFRNVIYFGHKEVMKLLAPHLKVNPADSSFLEAAIRLDRPKTLKRLLKLGIFDPMANGANALREVLISSFGSPNQLRMVKILLADSRMDLSRVPAALIWAHCCIDPSAFELLLQQPNINPLCRDPDSDPMTLDAKGFFTIPVIQGGLLDYKPPPVPEDQKDPTIIDIMLKGFGFDQDLLFLVLNHPRVNFDYYAGYTILRALQSKRFQVAEAVLNDARVHVIDRKVRRIALDCAKENSLKDIAAKIRTLKKAKLDFKCPNEALQSE